LGEIIIEKINYKAFVVMLANLFFLIASIAIMILGFKDSKAMYWLPSAAAALAFLVGFIAALINVMQVKRLITITMDGIIDTSSISGAGFISYDDIKEFIIVTVYGKKVIAVIPKNIDVFLIKLSAVKRRLAKRNISLNLPPIMIPVNLAKDMEPEDILSLLTKRLSDNNSLY
jgi:hypothetical protein